MRFGSLYFIVISPAMGRFFYLWGDKWTSIRPGFGHQISYKSASGSGRSGGIMVSMPVSPDLDAEQAPKARSRQCLKGLSKGYNSFSKRHPTDNAGQSILDMNAQDLFISQDYLIGRITPGSSEIANIRVQAQPGRVDFADYSQGFA